MTTGDVSTLSDLLQEYVGEADMAQIRQVKPRALRAERQHKRGPPWLRIGAKVYYPKDGFKNWLRAIEQRPVEMRGAA
jgi:hypothetical protein